MLGLRSGADDYICKPFGMEELIARVEAVLRRVAKPAGSPMLLFADLELNQETYLASRAGEEIVLTATEFRLLQYLMLNPRCVLSKNQIMEYVWDDDFIGDPNIVETYISYLRKKIDRVGQPLIHTVRGFGYTLRQSAQ